MLSDRRLLPKRGIDWALHATGLLGKFKLDSSADAAICELYDEIVSNALAFGCSNAKRRKVRGRCRRGMRS
eukprot:362251-Chlamydomonas_euryale.AAC.3